MRQRTNDGYAASGSRGSVREGSTCSIGVQDAQGRVVLMVTIVSNRVFPRSRGCEGSTIRRKLSAVSSLFAYLCERNAVVHNPVQGVKRPKVTNAKEGLTPALSDEQARLLLNAPPAETLKGKRDRAILATLLYHGLRREELCKL